MENETPSPAWCGLASNSARVRPERACKRQRTPCAALAAHISAHHRMTVDTSRKDVGAFSTILPARPAASGLRACFLVCIVYNHLMAKRRINLYIDEDVFKRVKAMCSRLGEDISPSIIANEALAHFDRELSPVFEKAMSGDKAAALVLMSSAGLNVINEASNMLRDVHTQTAKLTPEGRAT